MSYYVGNMAELTWRYAAVRQSRLRGLSAGSTILAAELGSMLRVGPLGTNLVLREEPTTSTYDLMPPIADPEHRRRKINETYEELKDAARRQNEPKTSDQPSDEDDDGVEEPGTCEQDPYPTCPSE